MAPVRHRGGTPQHLAAHLGVPRHPYAGIGWLDAIIPFGSVYRPLWLGLGAVAFDLMIALIITSLLRPRINVALWRAVHWTSYLCWPLAMTHSLGTGSDTHGWALLIELGCLGVVGVAGLSRLVANGRTT